MTQKKNLFHTIGEKEMDRKNFLRYSGLVLLSLIGLKGLVNVLIQSQSKVVINDHDNKPRGFGSGKYGV